MRGGVESVVVGLHRTSSSSSTSESIGSNNSVIVVGGNITTRQRSNSMPRNITVTTFTIAATPLPGSPPHRLRRSSTSARLERRRSSMLSEILPRQLLVIPSSLFFSYYSFP